MGFADSDSQARLAGVELRGRSMTCKKEVAPVMIDRGYAQLLPMKAQMLLLGGLWLAEIVQIEAVNEVPEWRQLL